MLRETGAIFDDGTVVALAPDRLLITTTSGNASRVFTWLEEWHQTEWPQLRVAILPVTEQWATLSLAGPKSRSILSRIDCDFPLQPSSFPHLTLREGRIMGAPARIHRVSFTGEITYEISVPADAGTPLWEALIQSGRAMGLQPLGLDALLLLRLEKGFLHIGTETDGTTIPDDVGWGNVAAAKSRDFIGKRSLSLPENRRPDRLQLVGLKSTGGVPFIVGSHLRLEGSFYPTDGWITSAGSAVLTKDHIALALLRSGRNRVGALVSVYDAGKIVTRAQVVRPPFYDPSGDRMNG
jgi:sarcosine oxidase subunit alpha